MNPFSSSELTRLRDGVACVATELPVRNPPFVFSVGLCADYSSLFDRSYDETAPASLLLEVASRRGRVLLHAEGGSGKTTVLHNLYRAAAEAGSIATLVDLRRWETPIDSEWDALRDNAVLRAHLLLSVLGTPSVDEATLAALPPGVSRLVLVDGLSELPRERGNAILQTLGAFAFRNPAAGVIVADRMARRTAAEEGWALASILPFTTAQISQFVPAAAHGNADNDLLSRAFFLDLALADGIDASSSAETFRRYFTDHVGMTWDELSVSAEAAFTSYAKYKSRMFAWSKFLAVAGEPAGQRIIDAGLIAGIDGTTYFKHHLYHDFLAAFWLTADSQRWSDDSFDVISFRGSSYDGVALALELIVSGHGADEFLRRVYDWNFYASAYALAKGRLHKSVEVTTGMELALLAMLAERRWDPILGTAERVDDALRLFPPGRADEFLAADSLDAVRDIIARAQLDDPSLDEWRRLYLHPNDERASAGLVSAVASDGSLIGWTASNVLRRVSLTSEEQARLRNYLEHPSKTVRWRVVHSLGRHPNRANAKALMTALNDEAHWVRYGAIRSLVEQAALDEGIRDRIVSQIASQVGKLLHDPWTLQELERALLLREPPAGWAAAVEPIITALWTVSRSIEEDDRWRRLAYSIERQTKAA